MNKRIQRNQLNPRHVTWSLKCMYIVLRQHLEWVGGGTLLINYIPEGSNWGYVFAKNIVMDFLNSSV